MNDRLLTAREAAQVLGVSERTVRRRIKDDELPWKRHPVYHKGGRLEIRLSDVLALLPASDRAAALERLK